jgi:HSP20 family molecular chaperone IbpA
MVRRFHRSIYDELDELRNSMDYLFQLALDPMDNPLLPQEDSGIISLFPHNLNVEVTENDEDVMVTINTMPGIETSKISVQLRDRNTLNITCDRQAAVREGDDRHVRQDRSVSLHQEIPLPWPVMRCGARSTLNHGVLDLHLKKMQPVQS